MTSGQFGVTLTLSYLKTFALLSPRPGVLLHPPHTHPLASSSFRSQLEAPLPRVGCPGRPLLAPPCCSPPSPQSSSLDLGKARFTHLFPLQGKQSLSCLVHSGVPASQHSARLTVLARWTFLVRQQPQASTSQCRAETQHMLCPRSQRLSKTQASHPPVGSTGFNPDGAAAAVGRGRGVKEAGFSMEEDRGRGVGELDYPLVGKRWSGKAAWGR